ncbi:MAG TPA: hypothetical protein VLL75_21765 [Vicinamibacteria bacterium]|nr:hypothetical protein [Vicinamibacteria bacterium]
MEDEMQEKKSVLDGTIDRRRFTLASAMAILSGVVITISEAACGDNYSPSTPTPTPTPTPNPTPGPAGDKVGAISSNHGHTAVITGAQLTAGAAVTVELTVGNGHTHTASLSAAEVMSIAGGTRVSKESTNDSGHSHTVTFN